MERQKDHRVGFDSQKEPKEKNLNDQDSNSESEVAQSCPTLCDPIDGNLPGSEVHGIFQARILEWASISFSRGSSQPRDSNGSPLLELVRQLSRFWLLISSCAHMDPAERQKERTHCPSARGSMATRENKKQSSTESWLDHQYYTQKAYC